MRNLKRALSLAMASIMVIGMMVVGAGAVSISDFSDGEKIVNKEAVSVLTTLQVLKGRDDGSFDPTGVVTRGEMAKMICVVLNGGRDPQIGNITANFPDAKGHWAEAFIAYCANLGIIAGKGNGNFEPNATVTGAEAAKMLLTAIGYKADVEGYVGANWQTNVDVDANQQGMYDGLGTLNTSEGLTRDNAAQMVFNALDCTMVEYTYVITGTADNSITTKPQVTSKDRGTLLQEKFKADKVEAIVISNEHAALNNNYASADDAGETTLEVISVNGTALKTAETDTYKVSTTEDMLGQRVAVYIKYNTNSVGYDADNAVVIGSPIIVSRNKVVTSTNGDKLATITDDNNLNITDSTKYFVNYGGYYGGVVYGGDPSESPVAAADKDNAVKTMTSAQFDVEAALTGVTVKLIDNNGDKDVDYALAVKYSYGMVNKYNTTDKGAFRIQGLFNEDEYKSASVVGFEDVALNDLVLFTEFGGKVHVQKPETMEGKLENYSTSKKNVKIDGETIKWSLQNGTILSEMETIKNYVITSGVLNTNATYYKDQNGYIFGVSETDESMLTYAVLLGFENQTGAQNGKLGTDARAKLLLADGTSKTYDVATIDGKKVTNCTSLLNNAYYPANSSEIGFAKVNQYSIYSYSFNENGSIKLASKSGSMVNNTTSQTDPLDQSATVTYDKGKSTITASVRGTAKNYTVTDRTVFLYVKTDGTISRFVGRTAPSIENTTPTQISVRYTGTRGEALVVFLNAKNPSADFKDNFAYVYNTKVSQNGDSYEVKAVVDGKIETYMVEMAYDSTGAEVIRPDNVSGKHTINVGLYNYSKDGNFYTLTQRGMANATSGIVDAVRSDYIRVNGMSYTVNSNTKFFETRTNKDAQENITVSANDTVSVVYNDEGKAVYVFLTKYNYETGVTPPTPGTGTVNTVTLNPITGKLDIRYYGSALTTAQIKTAVSAFVGEEVLSYNGVTGEAKTASDVYAVNTTQVQVRKVTYNGEFVAYVDDSVLTTVTVTPSAGSVKIVAGLQEADATNWADAASNGSNIDKPVTLTADLVLTDGYAVTTGGLTVTAGGTAIVTGNLVASGTALTVEGVATTGKNAIKATVGTETIYGDTTDSSGTVKATLNYTVNLAAVTFAEVAMYVVNYNGTEVETVEIGEVVQFDASFSSTNANMGLLVNKKAGATTSAGAVNHAGNTVLYTVNATDATSANVINIVDGYKVTLASVSGTDKIEVGGTAITDGQFIAADETITATPDSGRNVASTTPASTALSGSFGTANSAVTFKMPAGILTVTFAA